MNEHAKRHRLRVRFAFCSPLAPSDAGTLVALDGDGAPCSGAPVAPPMRRGLVVPMALAPLPSLPRSGGRARAPRPCSCGCGLLSRGGAFCPGHDSRRLGWALRLWLGASVDGISPGERDAALAWIRSGAAVRMFPARFVAPAASGVLLLADVADVA